MDDFEIVYETINIVENNLLQLNSVTTVSQKMGYSTNYINRIFKMIFGFTVLDYIKMRKITDALKNYKKFNNIIDIAFEYNFNSHEVFIRNCKKYFKESPGTILKEANWKGMKKIEKEILWFYFNKDQISIKSVKLPDLVLKENSYGNVKISSLGFTGDMSKLIWNPKLTFKLIPKGIYRCLIINKTSQAKDIESYIKIISPNSPVIIEFIYENRSIFYFK